MTERDLESLQHLFPEGGSRHEPTGPEARVDPFAPDRVETVICWAWDDYEVEELDPRRETSEVEPGLDGYRWIQNQRWKEARKGQVWMRYERKLESPRRVSSRIRSNELAMGPAGRVSVSVVRTKA